MKITKLLFASIIALAPSVAIAQNQLPQVISVRDGDTVRIAINGKPETVRLGCIDAPEKNLFLSFHPELFVTELLFELNVG